MNINTAAKLRQGILRYSQVWTILGYEFEGATKFEMDAADVKFVSFNIPSYVTDKFVALQTRTWKADESDIDLDILWNTSFSSGTPITIFNSYRGKETSVVEFTEDPVVDVTDSIIREQDFLSSGGSQGNNGSSGQLDPLEGFRLYLPGEHFVVRITNVSQNNNTVLLGYRWVELPIGILRDIQG